jgi:hypothetical protein
MSGVPILTNLTRQGVGNYPLLNDTDVKGGIWSVADKTARLAIQSGLRKAGMLVRELDTDDIWELNVDLVTWGMFGIGAFPSLGERRIYARPTGSDATGDGSLATPYASLTRCLKDVPHPIPKGRYYFLDITGITEDVFGGLRIESFEAEDNATLWDFGMVDEYELPIRCPLYIYAKPKLATTVSPADAHIAAGEVVSQTVDVATGMYSIKTTKTWAVDALKGKFVSTAFVGEFLQSAPIATNTADTLVLAGAMLITTTSGFDVVECSAKIVNSDSSSGRAAITLDTSATVALTGVATEMTYGWGWGSFEAVGKGACYSAISRHQGIYIHSDRGSWFTAWSIFLDHPGALFGYIIWGENTPSGTAELDCFHMIDCAQARIPFNGIIDTGKIEGGVGLTIDGSVSISKITGLATSPYGIVVSPAANVKVDAGTTIAGATNDMKVGNRAVRSWADFRANAPLKNELDVDATTGTLARLWQA